MSLLDKIIPVIRANLPAGITPAYFDGFVARNRAKLEPALEGLYEEYLRKQGQTDATPPEEWTAGRRTKANLAAMRLAASKHPKDMTAEDKRILAGYSGWGGLSIESSKNDFPTGFPIPEERGLIHEYYTPSKVCSEVARVVKPLLPSLVSDSGFVLTLEPSAGIGRFIRAFTGAGFETLRWLAVEWSDLSSRMLQAIRPDLDLFVGPFERWVRERGASYEGRIDLVVSNPPYGPRGMSITEDPDRSYREKQAYVYFLRRCLNLLAPGGLGVFLVPAGFLTGQGARNLALREKVLKGAHLSTAYRLPSNTFPGAMLVTDLLFFRGRGGDLLEVPEGDRSIVDGQYFQEHPEHILGQETGTEGGEDDQTKRGRWGYQVIGTFDRLPDIEERPLCAGCTREREPKAGKKHDGGGATRTMGQDTSGLDEVLVSAVVLGVRVDAYLASLSAGDTELPSLLWRELHDGLVAWVDANGNPWAHTGLITLAREGSPRAVGAERFLSAFQKTGRLIESLQTKPKYEPRYQGKPDDVVAQAEMLFRSNRKLDVGTLMATHNQLGGKLGQVAALTRLFEAGWFIDGPAWDQLMPREYALSGVLWPRYDRSTAKAKDGDVQAAMQARLLMDAIKPAVYDDIEGISPRQGWIPLKFIEGWLSETLNERYGAFKLVREDGLVQPSGIDYDSIEDVRNIAPETVWCLGWINHDKTVFKPKKKQDEDIDKVRMEKAKEWDASFRAWCGSKDEYRTAIEYEYNRNFRGFIPPTYSGEGLQIVRWAKGGVTPHPHQASGARRILTNRGGLLAFDVGVGKTYTAEMVIAMARQEGWVRRPVVLVPNSIVWKWYADFQRALPDYRVGVIGSRRKIMSRGPRKGLLTSEPDSPQERARKWTRFQGGEFDVILLTYTALARTRMNEKAVKEYADATEAIRREVKLRQRNAATSKKPSERQQAVLREGVAAWIAEQMEIPEGWEYDPGIAWDDIGIDMLVVDEAQNYKNLYLPEAREGGVPRFMGNAGEGSKRSWQLDFRAAVVRKKTGGAGIVLLSATPAKNSPLEFYNLVQYVDHDAWVRMGIRDPEQFIDRYLKIELKEVIGTNLDVSTRSAVVGFQNLDELRDVVFRYGEFKTAEQVGLKLPKPAVNFVDVAMDSRQDKKYDRYVKEIEDALDSEKISDKAKILGLLARMALVAIHADLDDGNWDWKNANSSIDPNEGPQTALVRRGGKPVTQEKIDKYLRILALARRGANEDERQSAKNLLALMETDYPGVRDAALKAERLSGEYAGGGQAPPKATRTNRAFGAGELVNPHSPKFDAIAKRVALNKTCGHIIFVDNIAAHAWMREVLIRAGIAAERIAILNAEVAKSPADRTRIAEEFNGNEDAGEDPKYDVVIANAVAYEGIDLQTRTCAIHHVDLPWEPATLQQRNGRGVRQGNTLQTIEVNYYFALRSSDGMRFSLIQGKRAWLVALIESQARDTNNPGAQMDLGPEEILLLISRNPEKTRERLKEVREKREREAREQVATEASRLLKGINARFRKAEGTSDPADSARLRLEGEERLKDLSSVDPEAWPWADVAANVRNTQMLVPDDGSCPVYEGMRIGRPSPWNPDKLEYIEFGRIKDGSIGVRESGTSTWAGKDGKELSALHISRENLAETWPIDDAEKVRISLPKRVSSALSYSASWQNLNITWASDSWIERFWPSMVQDVARVMASVQSWYSEHQRVPVEQDGKLQIASGPSILRGTILPPTKAGWMRFLALAAPSGLKFTELEEAGDYWWERRLPRDILSREKKKAEANGKGTQAAAVAA